MTALAAPAIPSPLRFLPLVAAGLVVSGLWTMPADLATEARVALIVTVLAVIGWVATRIPDALVALAAALALVLAGALPEERLYATLGNELIWLLLAAFVIAAVVKDSGLMAHALAPLTRRRPGFAAFALGLAGMIALTALVLPSTSGRAALLLPVFVALVAALPDARLTRPLALIFPTVILLSAGGSLVGAGAHLVAVEAIAATGGPVLGYGDWLMLGGPLAVAASLAGLGLILGLFVPRGLLGARMAPVPAPGRMTVEQRRILLGLVGLVGLWATEGWHGLGMGLVALMGATLLLTPAFGKRKTKDVFRAVDVELILFMAATVLMAQALTGTGADRWLAAQAMAALPAPLAGHLPVVAVALAAVAVLSHLVITSRSARAAVLIPAVALPVGGLGHDPALMVMIAVMGTGFCQTMTASAKPVAIYGAEGAFGQRDLMRLALPLAPVMVALVAAAALWLWPAQLAGMRGVAVPAAVMAPVSAEVRQALAEMPDLPRPTLPPTTAERIALSEMPGLQVSLRPRPRTEIWFELPQEAAPAPRPRVQEGLVADLERAERTVLRQVQTLDTALGRIFR